MSGIWGEFLRMRGRLHAAAGRSTEAYHDFGQSVSVFDLLGRGVSGRASATWSSGGWPPPPGRARGRDRLPDRCRDDLRSPRRVTGSAGARAALNQVPAATTGGYVGVQMDGDDALVRRMVDASALPALLARDGAAALLEACDAQAAVLFVQMPGGQVRVVGPRGCDAEGAPGTGGCRARAAIRPGSPPLLTEQHRAQRRRPQVRRAVGARPLAGPRTPAIPHVVRRAPPGVRVVPGPRASAGDEPGRHSSARSSRCCLGSSAPSAAMQRVAEQIQRMQGNDLTVLITGESGTGKDLVARAIHAGSPRHGQHVPSL